MMRIVLPLKNESWPKLGVEMHTNAAIRVAIKRDRRSMYFSSGAVITSGLRRR